MSETRPSYRPKSPLAGIYNVEQAVRNATGITEQARIDILNAVLTDLTEICKWMIRDTNAHFDNYMVAVEAVLNLEKEKIDETLKDTHKQQTGGN